jgi:hypothetical protein
MLYLFIVHLIFDQIMSNWLLRYYRALTTLLDKNITSIAKRERVAILQTIGDTKFHKYSVALTFNDQGEMIQVNQLSLRNNWSKFETSGELLITLRNLWNAPQINIENRRMSTCNWLDLQTLGSQPIMPKNLRDIAYIATRTTM